MTMTKVQIMNIMWLVWPPQYVHSMSANMKGNGKLNLEI